MRTSTYYAMKSRQPSLRSVKDEKLKVEITEIYEDNYSVYGADKLWAQLKRQGHRVARCTVERLMRTLGLRGVTRGSARAVIMPTASPAATSSDQERSPPVPRVIGIIAESA